MEIVVHPRISCGIEVVDFKVATSDDVVMAKQHSSYGGEEDLVGCEE